MIARLWRGATRLSDAERYLEYLEETGVKDYRATPGNRGVLVMRRLRPERAEFLLVTLWESFEAIARFAGEPVEKARYYPADEAFLLELTPEVEHYELASSAGTFALEDLPDAGGSSGRGRRPV
jgi:heme-degrading monooxygenase HmoA